MQDLYKDDNGNFSKQQLKLLMQLFWQLYERRETSTG
jgi:hypothetical protein